MTTVVVVEGPAPSFITLSVDSNSVVEAPKDTYVVAVTESNSISLISLVEQGPAGPSGAADYENLPDLYLFFEGALI